ncbi:uncharacterized protein LOC143078057 [Mytilus galloprovincialis]|uniref:uncharacterized protein LOC143078057 n=1 Tax=Mytilus galloprovincialis TaxID=29158 RepID=UPI003F7C5FF5
MDKICTIFIYICHIIIFMIGAVSVGGGIYIIAGFDKMDEKSTPTFDKAKDNIRKMIQVLNVFPGVEIIHPPNNTMSEPLKDMNYEGFVRACGLFLLVFGAVISAISVLGLVGTFRKSRRLTITYVVALGLLTIIQIAAVVLFSADRTIVNKLIFKHFFKSLDESYKGFKSNDPVSIGWNLFMQQFNCCGIHGYTDFQSSNSFDEKWGEPIHTMIQPHAINFAVACCNSIEIHPQGFQGPCREKDYIHKRGCIDVFWETADTYQAPVIALVSIACLIQLSQIIVTCYTKIIKSNKSNNKKTDQMDTKKYNNFAPSKKDIKLGPKNPVYSEEEMWYPEVQTNNSVSPQKQAWDTGNGDDILEEKDKWYSGDRRKPMKRPNRSLVMDF